MSEMCKCGLAEVEISLSGENIGACVSCLWEETYGHALGEIGRNSRVAPMPIDYLVKRPLPPLPNNRLQPTEKRGG